MGTNRIVIIQKKNSPEYHANEYTDLLGTNVIQNSGLVMKFENNQNYGWRILVVVVVTVLLISPKGNSSG